MFQTKAVEKLKRNTLYVRKYFLQNRAVYETPWKSIVKTFRPQMTTSALHAVQVGLQTHTENM